MINDQWLKVREQWTEVSEQRLPHISMRVLRSAVGAICKSPYAGACDRGQWTVSRGQSINP